MPLSSPVRRGEEVKVVVGRVTTTFTVARPKECQKDISGAPALVGRTSEIKCSVPKTRPEPRVAGSENDVVPVTGPRRPRQ